MYFLLFTKILIFFYDLILTIFELIPQIHFLRLDGLDKEYKEHCLSAWRLSFDLQKCSDRHQASSGNFTASFQHAESRRLLVLTRVLEFFNSDSGLMSPEYRQKTPRLYGPLKPRVCETLHAGMKQSEFP